MFVHHQCQRRHLVCPISPPPPPPAPLNVQWRKRGEEEEQRDEFSFEFRRFRSISQWSVGMLGLLFRCWQILIVFQQMGRGESSSDEGVTWNAGMYVNYFIVPFCSSDLIRGLDGVALAAAPHKKTGDNGRRGICTASPLKLMDGDHGQAFNGRIREDAGFECRPAHMRDDQRLGMK